MPHHGEVKNQNVFSLYTHVKSVVSEFVFRSWQSLFAQYLLCVLLTANVGVRKRLSGAAQTLPHTNHELIHVKKTHTHTHTHRHFSRTQPTEEQPYHIRHCYGCQTVNTPCKSRPTIPLSNMPTATEEPTTPLEYIVIGLKVRPSNCRTSFMIFVVIRRES
jgi:hypothetical protein